MGGCSPRPPAGGAGAGASRQSSPPVARIPSHSPCNRQQPPLHSSSSPHTPSLRLKQPTCRWCRPASLPARPSAPWVLPVSHVGLAKANGALVGAVSVHVPAFSPRLPPLAPRRAGLGTSLKLHFAPHKHAPELRSLLIQVGRGRRRWRGLPAATAAAPAGLDWQCWGPSLCGAV